MSEFLTWIFAGMLALGTMLCALMLCDYYDKEAKPYWKIKKWFFVKPRPKEKDVIIFLVVAGVLVSPPGAIIVYLGWRARLWDWLTGYNLDEELEKAFRK